MKTQVTKMQLDIVIIPEKENNKTFHTARCMQIPNVVTQGDTIEEARENIQEALALYLEEAPEEKIKIMETTEIDSAPLISRILV